MKIHSSARFTGKAETYHNDFDVQLFTPQILANREIITNLAIAKFKVKCEQNFKVEFGMMIFFEVYLYKESEEITIFKKEKI
jgi:hypothetical protein